MSVASRDDEAVSGRVAVRSSLDGCLVLTMRLRCFRIVFEACGAVDECRWLGEERKAICPSAYGKPQVFG